MKIFKTLALTASVVGGLTAAVPAQAVVTTFASFQAVGGTNVRWTKVGTTGGTFSQINSVGNPLGANTQFSFAQPYFVNNGFGQMLAATFQISGTTSGDAATKTVIPGVGTFLNQNVDSLSFSFKARNAFQVGNITYQAGTNLLTVTAGSPTTNSSINGFQGATSGAETNSTALAGHSLVYSSEVLDFSNTVDRSFSISLDAILNGTPNQGLQAVNGQSLTSFRATAGGSFSSDPVPLINGVPEPAVWGLMIAGFGMVGFQSRRRREITSVTA